MVGMIDMFEPAERLDKSSLYQGDVIRNVPAFGAINLKNCMLHSSLLGGDSPGDSGAIDVTITKSIRRCDVVVLSHSCEIAQENGEKVTSIIVAPLRDLSTATKPDKIQELIDSNDVDPASGKGFSYLKYYHLICKDCQFPAGAIVDFNKVFSFHKSVHVELLKNKSAQMTEAARNKFALKLAVYFYREQGRLVA